MSNLTQNEKSAVVKFKSKAREFWGLWNALDQKRGSELASSPEFRDEYNDLMNRGVTIRKSVEGITGAIDKAAGLYTDVKDWLSERFTFGIIPLIPVAGALIAVSAMTKWISDAYQLNKRFEQVQQLINQGMTPQRAADAVKTLNKSGFFTVGGMAKVVPLLLAGGALFYFLRNKK